MASRYIVATSFDVFLNLRKLFLQTMKMMILFIQWTVAAILIVGSLGGYMNKEYLAATLSLAVGIVLLPPVVKHFNNKSADDNNLTFEEKARLSEQRFLAMVSNGESAILEFKGTLRIDLKTNKPEKFIQHAVIKTIAAFLNSNGGILLIGVNDEKNIIGLDADFNSFSGNDKKDEFQKFLDTLIANNIGDRFQRYIQIVFVEISGKTACAVTVLNKSSLPVYISHENHEKFYIRRQASSIDLKPSEAVIYVKEHWG